MSQINSGAGLLGAGAAQNTQTTDAFGSLDTAAFLDLLVVELQNQDPLDPADNEQLLNQIFQIRQIESDEALTDTLEAVLLGQNVSSATNLIGADIVGLNDQGQRVSGNVQSVAIDGSEPTLEIATASGSSRGEIEGDVAEGRYTYEVVWTLEDGQEVSVQVDANTASFEDFQGSIRLENLPETSVVKQVYRTDNTGSGARQFVSLVRGQDTTFLDTTADDALGQELLSTPVQVPFAASQRVRLSNIGEITPPQQ